ncbi:hypothetical protein ScPMuIL_017202 [Solemya velum]
MENGISGSTHPVIDTHNDDVDTRDALEEIVYALSDFKGLGTQLTFSQGSCLKVLSRPNEHWWWAEREDGCQGYAPVNHLTTLTRNRQYGQDMEYFDSYSHLKIHHEMLDDKARTLAYQTAIRQNAHLLTDKVILDVGCGTGILSMMCARYGRPKQVYAVEASDIAEYTKDVIHSNKMSDTVTVLHSKVEEVQLEESVDVIISEWMGTILLFEMMVESVLLARDRLLKDGGTLWPSTASLFLVPCSAQKQYGSKMEFWKDQYGFDLSDLIEIAKEEFLQKPVHNHILDPADCLSEASRILNIDMRSVRREDLEQIDLDFEFTVQKSGTLHGFCTWFQVDFEGLDQSIHTVYLNTGPEHELTHWKQNLFLLDSPLSVDKDDVITGQFNLHRNPEWRRHLRVLLRFRVMSSSNNLKVPDREKLFYVWR